MVEAIPLNDESRRMLRDNRMHLVKILSDGIRNLEFAGETMEWLACLYKQILPIFIRPSGNTITECFDVSIMKSFVDEFAITASEATIMAFKIFLKVVFKDKYVRERREIVISVLNEDVDEMLDKIFGSNFFIVGCQPIGSLIDDIDKIKKFTNDEKFIKKYEKGMKNFLKKVNKMERGKNG